MKRKIKKQVTTEDIAEIAGVSRATVSYVLNNTDSKRISEKTRRKIKKIAKELDYIPNPYAKGLKTRMSKTIALILQTITDPSMPTLIKGIETATNFNEFSLIMHDLDVKTRDIIHDIELLCQKPLNGIIFAYPDEKDKPIIEYLMKKRNMPIVVIGTRFDDININTIETDSYGAGETLAKYLYNLGHKDIIIVSGNKTKSRKKRIEGFMSVYNQYGIEVDVHYGKIEESKDFSFFDNRAYMLGFNAVSDILACSKKYDSIVCMNDMIAIGVINALKKRSISIPKNISITAFGGYFISELVEPALTVMEVPSYEIGKNAFELLKHEIDDIGNNVVKKIIYNYRLVKRESTRAINI